MNNTIQTASIQDILRIEFTTRNLVKIAMLSAVAFVLMLLSFPLAAFFPPFLKLDLSDLPALMGGFALGPVAGVLIELIKNILNILIKGTDTGGIGELSNFIVGSFFIVPASIIYMRNKSKKNAVLGLLAGVVFMTVSACFSNYFLILPLYQKFMPLEQIIESSPLSIVKDMRSFILFAIAPFNLLKSSIVSSITLLTYKKLSPVLHK
ncbi:MAG: ECF transporter S component [Caldicoprobacterales bacterium]|jgi:riboflavin transporter FmnP|nr:ECF transporter S component [Clostridiales bacterium]